MSLDTRFDEKTGVLWLILEGKVDFQEVMRTVDDLYGTDACDRRIWDVRNTTDMQFGMSRALQPRVNSGTLALGVFKDEDEALAWVTETQIDP